MTLRNTIEDLLCEYFSGDQGENSQADTFLFLTSLVHCGCDGFEIIDRVSICAGAGNYVSVDPYILLVGKKKAVFLDINRKRSFFYSYEGGENYDFVGHL